MEKPRNLEAWHFVDDTLRDGRPVPADGVKLVYDGPLKICAQGLHASERIIDALFYSKGNMICRVQIEGAESQGEDDKIVGRTRTILWRINGEPVLREFARKCALDVIHLWDAPPVVRQYLETGNECIRDAARAAAMAAGDAAWDKQNTRLTDMVMAAKEAQ